MQPNLHYYYYFVPAASLHAQHPAADGSSRTPPQLAAVTPTVPQVVHHHQQLPMHTGASPAVMQLLRVAPSPMDYSTSVSSHGVATLETQQATLLGTRSSTSRNSSSVEQPSPTCLYVKNLPPETDQLFLYKKFSRHGAISKCHVCMDEETGACRGTAYVHFLHKRSAYMAMVRLQGYHIRHSYRMHISVCDQDPPAGVLLDGPSQGRQANAGAPPSHQSQPELQGTRSGQGRSAVPDQVPDQDTNSRVLPEQDTTGLDATEDRCKALRRVLASLSASRP